MQGGLRREDVHHVQLRRHQVRLGGRDDGICQRHRGPAGRRTSQTSPLPLIIAAFSPGFHKRHHGVAAGGGHVFDIHREWNLPPRYIVGHVGQAFCSCVLTGNGGLYAPGGVDDPPLIRVSLELSPG